MIERILPSPKKVEKFEGVTPIAFSMDTKNEPWKKYCETACITFEKMFCRPLTVAPGGATLVLDPTLKAKSYRIDSRDGVILSASDDEGILYAIATFLQLAAEKRGRRPVEKDGMLQIEKVIIEDWPEKDYRGLMVDLARQWHPVRTLHNYIDMCFMSKIKYLHLHFIDNQNYTLPSKAFPKLNDPGRFYSTEDIASLNEHAERCGVVIIPEFEAPGHAQQLVERYPEIFANEIEGGNDAVMYTEQGLAVTAKNVLCAGSDNTFRGIHTLLEEICQLFPNAPYIHIGGDEANIKVWDLCSVCKDYMEKNHLSGSHELYSDFVGRVAKLVLGMGRTPIVWEGFPKDGVDRIPKETIVVAWESVYHLAPDLIKAGFQVINCGWKPLYIVPSLTRRWNYKDIFNWSVYHWSHFWSASPTYLNPINLDPTEQVIGGQLAAWECTYEQEISRIIENLPALAERTWTASRVLDEEAFCDHLNQITKMLALLIREV